MTEMIGRLAGRVAIVTGAGSGIGRASAERMAAEGAGVVVADIDAAAADEVVGAITDVGGAALAVAVDVADAEQVERMVARAVEHFGGLDVLFNNAAILHPEFRAGDTDVEQMDVDVWDRTMQVNLRGPMLGCKYAIPELRRRGGGSIIVSSSTAATQGDFIRCAYGVSKGGLNSLVKYVATAFGHQGIRCNAVAPGVVASPAVRKLHTEASLAALTSHHVVARLGTPEDVAAVAAFLASDDSAFVTGEVLTVDGGFTCHLPTYATSPARR